MAETEASTDVVNFNYINGTSLSQIINIAYFLIEKVNVFHMEHRFSQSWKCALKVSPKQKCKTS